MNPNYPLTLNLADKRVVVVGGGIVATRRLPDLLNAKALVRVISPIVTSEIEDLAARGQLELVRRDYNSGDLRDAWLAYVATGNFEVDSQVAKEANENKIFSVVMSDASLATAWRPAVALGKDGVSVAISGGGDPRRAMAIRDAISLQLDIGTLPIRAHRSKNLAQNQIPDPSNQSVKSDQSTDCVKGVVYLVGGGPGIVDLLTLRARYILSLAEVVVVDRLAPREILKELAEDVEIIDCGKTPGDHKLTQDEINRTIVEKALAGKCVVRLKGGDPFVLGRGSEEMQACLEAGIKCEVIPGVSSAISVPLAAGIPLTHRGFAQGFTVINGHGDFPLSVKDFKKTYVILMGVEHLPHIVDRFLEDGWDHNSPIAVIESGWLPNQRTTVGELSNICDLQTQLEFKSPAVIVIGEVVKFHKEFGNQNGR